MTNDRENIENLKPNPSGPLTVALPRSGLPSTKVE